MGWSEFHPSLNAYGVGHKYKWTASLKWFLKNFVTFLQPQIWYCQFLEKVWLPWQCVFPAASEYLKNSLKTQHKWVSVWPSKSVWRKRDYPRGVCLYTRSMRIWGEREWEEQRCGLCSCESRYTRRKVRGQSWSEIYMWQPRQRIQKTDLIKICSD